MKIRVTLADILNGVRHDAIFCPMAHAINRQDKFAFVRVYDLAVVLEQPADQQQEPVQINATLAPSAHQWVHGFDVADEVLPGDLIIHRHPMDGKDYAIFVENPNWETDDSYLE